MPQRHPASDPFALMLDPGVVFQAMESSDRLRRLKSRICRPLDKPLLAKPGTEVDAFDKEVEALPDAEEAPSADPQCTSES